jgi:isoleucyl-tRNA synthetase
VIFRATVQWFMNIDHDDHRTKSLDAIQNVGWFPPESINRISAMVSGRPDWCLSRQRAWGVGIPVFYYQGQPVMTKESMGAVYDLTLREGSDAWFEKSPLEILGPDFVCPYGGDVAEYTKETDVLDVWFDSGSTCRAVLEHRPELHFPADVYLEGSDQHRGWFNSSLMVGVSTRGVAPFKQVISHGFLLDEKGRAMSKSMGNGIAPAQVVEQYGADVLRLWVATIDYFEDVRFGFNILKQTAEGYRKIRNTLRYLLGALSDFTPGQNAVAPEALQEIDRWALDRLQRVAADVTAGYESYQFVKVTRALLDFCSIDLSSFYFDVLKDRLYASAPDDQVRRSSQTALYEIASVLTRLIAPILPHTAEETWQLLPGGRDNSPTVELTVFPTADPFWMDDTLAEKWHTVLRVRDDVNRALENARNAGTVKKTLEATVGLNGPTDALAGFTDDELATLFLVSQITREENAPAGVTVAPAAGSKCARCWLVKRDIGTDADYADICGRCAEAVKTVLAAAGNEPGQ